MRTCGDGLPGGTSQSAALDCIGVAVGYSGEGRAAKSHGSQSNSYSDTLLIDSRPSNVVHDSPARVGQHGHVVQLSSSYHTSFHHHHGSGKQ